MTEKSIKLELKETDHDQVVLIHAPENINRNDEVEFDIPEFDSEKTYTVACYHPNDPPEWLRNRVMTEINYRYYNNSTLVKFRLTDMCCDVQILEVIADHKLDTFVISEMFRFNYDKNKKLLIIADCPEPVCRNVIEILVCNYKIIPFAVLLNNGWYTPEIPIYTTTTSTWADTTSYATDTG